MQIIYVVPDDVKGRLRFSPLTSSKTTYSKSLRGL